ncbi:hypothetical protein SAMN05444161_5243 [Rhizobiales bacterium GAS191]|jgi:hypothetical protein|nr:hypothetical protein SAMN05444161_5243 [Rhizobiales bacterium GAS191]SEE31325.1 hypothetical protein SAMN05519104_5748 [Rhizobiales bacterium GAS188]
MKYLKAFALGVFVSLLVQEVLAYGLGALMQQWLAEVVASVAIVILSAPIFIQLTDRPDADRRALCQAMMGALVPTFNGPCRMTLMLIGESGWSFANLALETVFLAAMLVTMCLVLHIVFTTEEIGEYPAWLRSRLWRRNLWRRSGRN